MDNPSLPHQHQFEEGGNFLLYNDVEHILLKAIKLARSTYYYHVKQLNKPDKDQELKAEIQSIFTEHKGNYGYRRIHLELRNRVFLVCLAVSRDSSRSNERV